MRITRVLCQQHIGTMFKRHWKVQGKRIPLPTEALSILREKGIPVIDAVDFAMPKPPTIPECVYLVERKRVKYLVVKVLSNLIESN